MTMRPEVDLKEGDAIKVGQTVWSFGIEAEQTVGPALCARCGKNVAEELGGCRQGHVCLSPHRLQSFWLPFGVRRLDAVFSRRGSRL
jgi:hypothetical protein